MKQQKWQNYMNQYRRSIEANYKALLGSLWRDTTTASATGFTAYLTDVNVGWHPNGRNIAPKQKGGSEFSINHFRAKLCWFQIPVVKPFRASFSVKTAKLLKGGQNQTSDEVKDARLYLKLTQHLQQHQPRKQNKRNKKTEKEVGCLLKF